MSSAARFAAILIALSATLAGADAAADVVAVVSAKSNIKSLTTDQIADIFLGRVNRFPNGLLALPVDQRDGSHDRDQFYAKVAGKTPTQLKAYWSKIIFTGRGQPPKSVPTEADVKRIIAANVAAIGYIDAAFLDDSLRAL